MEYLGTGTKDVKWNYDKFLLDEDGKVVKYYDYRTSPNEMRKDIYELLGAKGNIDKLLKDMDNVVKMMRDADSIAEPMPWDDPEFMEKHAKNQ